MTSERSRPLLFLDVDGPLIPFGGPAEWYEPRRARYEAVWRAERMDVGELLWRLDPQIGPRLSALPCQLVWATAWEDDANDIVAPRIGLPQLPVLNWPVETLDAIEGPLHWKTVSLVRWAEGRPFVWVDDEVVEADVRYVAAHHPGPALVHRVDGSIGLSDQDFHVIEAWLRGLSTGASAGADRLDIQQTGAEFDGRGEGGADPHGARTLS